MKCMKCGAADSSVLDTRTSDEGRSIRRRRACGECGYRFTTYERVETTNVIVIKADGTREPYDRLKLEEGIWRACTKRPIERKDINALIFDLEDQWFRLDEVTTKQIGEDVMDALKKLDEVAYIRFASVYRKFKDVETFAEELSELLRK